MSQEFSKSIADNYLSDKEFFSSGACPNCEECGLNDHPTNAELDTASESFFSWSPCICCGSTLGGDRHPAHYVDSNGDINHIDICTDCLFYVTYGQLPEDM